MDDALDDLSISQDELVPQTIGHVELGSFPGSVVTQTMWPRHLKIRSIVHDKQRSLPAPEPAVGDCEGLGLKIVPVEA